jgi:hypothetical protein
MLLDVLNEFLFFIYVQSTLNYEPAQAVHTLVINWNVSRNQGVGCHIR